MHEYAWKESDTKSTKICVKYCCREYTKCIINSLLKFMHSPTCNCGNKHHKWHFINVVLGLKAVIEPFAFNRHYKYLPLILIDYGAIMQFSGQVIVNTQ